MNKARIAVTVLAVLLLASLATNGVQYARHADAVEEFAGLTGEVRSVRGRIQDEIASMASAHDAELARFERELEALEEQRVDEVVREMKNTTAALNSLGEALDRINALEAENRELRRRR